MSTRYSPDLLASAWLGSDLEQMTRIVSSPAAYPRKRPSEDDPPIYACADCGLVEVFEKGALCAECDPNPPPPEEE